MPAKGGLKCLNPVSKIKNKGFVVQLLPKKLLSLIKIGVVFFTLLALLPFSANATHILIDDHYFKFHDGGCINIDDVVKYNIETHRNIIIVRLMGEEEFVDVHAKMYGCQYLENERLGDKSDEKTDGEMFFIYVNRNGGIPFLEQHSSTVLRPTEGTRLYSTLEEAVTSDGFKEMISKYGNATYLQGVDVIEMRATNVYNSEMEIVVTQ